MNTKTLFNKLSIILKPPHIGDMRVAIVGAGPCGLTSVKCCLDEGLEPVCFEKGPDLGGLWRYTTDKDHAAVYQSCVMVTSKEMSCFSDFPVPKDYPIYLPHSLVKTYLDLYADKFKLRPCIRYNTKIIKITAKTPEPNKNDKWQVTYEKHLECAEEGHKTPNETDTKDSGGSCEGGWPTETFTETFDAVLICSGHHWKPNVPILPGADTFEGEILHSSSYRESQRFQGKNILVVGIGDSGVAIATELSQHGGQVYLSTRRGSWITSRLQPYGLPSDQFLHRRFFFDLPRRILDWTCMKLVNLPFDHRDFGVLPSNSFLEQPPVVNDSLPYRILSGSVLVKPDVTRLAGKDAYFVDGSVATNIDVIILATGYHFDFPFLKDGCVEFKDNSPVLYKHMFRMEDSPTLAFIGCLQPVGCMFSVAEIQARLAARVFKGVVRLPRVEEMERQVRQRIERKKAECYDGKKHATAVYYIPYCDEIADLLGCKPRLGALLLSDPLLAWRCYFGACSPPQYRLTGPGSWDGARRAIMELPERNVYQMKKREAVLQKKSSSVVVVVTAAGIILMFFFYWLSLFFQ